MEWTVGGVIVQVISSWHTLGSHSTSWALFNTVICPYIPQRVTEGRVSPRFSLTPLFNLQKALSDQPLIPFLSRTCTHGYHHLPCPELTIYQTKCRLAASSRCVSGYTDNSTDLTPRLSRSGSHCLHNTTRGDLDFIFLRREEKKKKAEIAAQTWSTQHW